MDLILTKKLSNKVQDADEYIENGDPLKDVMDDFEIMEAIQVLASAIRDGAVKVSQHTEE